MTQLKTAEDFLMEKKEIKSGLKVRFVYEPLDGTIIGFVTVVLDEFIDTENYQIDAFANLIRFPHKDMYGKTSWQTKKISRNATVAVEKIPVANKFYIEHLDYLNHNWYEKLYKKWERGTLVSNCAELRRLFPERIDFSEGTYFYVPEANDHILSSRDIIHSVSQTFLCVCSYINPVKGKINYTLKPLNELIPILE